MATKGTLDSPKANRLAATVNPNGTRKQAAKPMQASPVTMTTVRTGSRGRVVPLDSLETSR